MINKNKKGQGLEINKLVIVILVGLAVVAALIFLFKADLLRYLRNLPGYDVPQEDKPVDLTEITDDEENTLCPFRIGGIGSDDLIFL